MPLVAGHQSPFACRVSGAVAWVRSAAGHCVMSRYPGTAPLALPCMRRGRRLAGAIGPVAFAFLQPHHMAVSIVHAGHGVGDPHVGAVVRERIRVLAGRDSAGDRPVGIDLGHIARRGVGDP